MRFAICLAGLLAVCGLAFAEVALSDDQKQLMRQLRMACMEEIGGIDEPTIDACKSGKFSDSPSLKCYLKCVYQQMTVMDDDGLVDADMMLTMLPEEYQPKAEPVLRACQERRGSDACDNAMIFNKCLYEMAPDYYMVP